MSDENTFELPDFNMDDASDFITDEGVTPPEVKKELPRRSGEPDEEEIESLVLTPDEEDVVKASDEETPSSKGIDSSSRKSASRTLAKALYEEGILSDYNEEEIAEDAELDVVFDLINKELDSKVQSYVNGLDSNLKDIAEAIDAGVDIDEYKRLKSAEVQLEKITDDQIDQDEGIRRKLLTSFYKETTSLDDTKIKKLVDRSVDLDEDVEDAKSARLDLIKIKQAKEKEMVASAQVSQSTAKKEAIKKLSALQSKIDSTAEIVPGVALTKRDKADLYKTLTDVVDSVQDSSGRNIPLNAVMANRAKNPTEWDMVVAHFHQLGLLNFEKDGSWKPDFSKLTKTAKSKAVQELQSVLSSGQNLEQSKSVYTRQGGGIKSDLDSLPTLNKGRTRI